MKINVVGFVNDNSCRVNVLKPILVKLVIFTATITLAMMLFYSTEKWAGIAIYAKEVLEFVLFIVYLTRKKKRRRE